MWILLSTTDSLSVSEAYKGLVFIKEIYTNKILINVAAYTV